MSIQQQIPESETEAPEVSAPATGVVDEVEGAAALMADIEALADDLVIDDYTAPASGINHGHAPDKHDVRTKFGVRDEFVETHFEHAPNDHAAVWELHYRKDEFLAAEDPIFKGDTPDDDAQTWAHIENTKTSAPIADETHRSLKRR